MSFFDILRGEIQAGIEGRNRGYSLGMPRLDKYVSLRKKMFYMIMGSTGSGKSSLLYDCFMLNPLELSRGSSRSLKYILFSMERSKSYILAKWLVRRVFLDTGRLIPMHVLLNWYGDGLTPEALELIGRYEDYFTFLEEHIDIYEGSRSPDDIFRIVMGDAELDGEVVQVSEYKKEYQLKPEKAHIDKVIALDHFGLTKTVLKYPNKKQAIDRLSEHIQYFRDFLGHSIIGVNQMNRDLSSPIYSKLDSFEPHLDNAKETGTTVEAADVVLSVFDPLRYNTNDRAYGNVEIFRDPLTGHKYFRNLKVLKNSYGIDDAPIGTVFQGETGVFRELPKSLYVKENWREDHYKSIFNNSYFLQ